MSDFREWLVLTGPWSFFLLVWAALTVLGLLAIGWQMLVDRLKRTDLAHRARRWWCRRVGHVPIGDERGAPVCAVIVCARCGKIGDRLPAMRRERVP